MLRLLSLILLISLLPRLAFAAPAGAVICIAQDHVSRLCHASTPDTRHDANAFTASFQNTDDTCVDLPQATDEVLTLKAVGNGQAFQPLVQPLAFASLPLSLCPIEHSAFLPEESAGFSARSFCRCIAIRC